MKYDNRAAFDDANVFGTGAPNDAYARFFTGRSFLEPLTNPGQCPVFLANVSFEPGCRTHWHTHHAEQGGGQMLLCTAGEGWVQLRGKKPVSLSEGSFVTIPAGVEHWHGAQADSWFSHISIEVPGEGGRVEWLEPVADADYGRLPSKPGRSHMSGKGQFSSKKDFRSANVFGTGIRNFMLSRYFSGRSYLKMLTRPGAASIFPMNVTFEPGCRNNWHVHRAESGGGQLLVCTAGEGWLQEDGQEAVGLQAGSVAYIPAGSKHWHGAKADSWFSHIALDVPGEGRSNEWLEAVDEAAYASLVS